MLTNLNGKNVKMSQCIGHSRDVAYFKDFCGATASITKNEDGSATLRTCAGNVRTCKEYKSYESAYQAWRRMCN